MRAFFLLWLTSAIGVAETNPVLEAVRSRDAVGLRQLLDSGADPNAAEPDGTSALQWAAHQGDAASVDLLVRAGASVKQTNRYGANALTEAAAAGNAAIVASLLAAGADPNTIAAEGETALMLAAASGNTEAVRILIEKGADVNAHEHWKQQTALMWAAAANRPDVARILIAHGADLNAHSTIWPPEVEHPANGNLVSKQPKGGLTALLYAARQGSLQAARVLAESGADLNMTEPDGTTPVIMALINAHYDLAAMLIEAGADPNKQDRYGRGPLYTAIDMYTMEPSGTRPAPRENDQLNGLDVAKLLLVKGANANVALVEPVPGRSVSDNPDPILRAGATPFIRAAKTGDVAGMQLLLANGADPKAATTDGVNALMAAAGQGWRYGDSVVLEAAALRAVELCLDLGLDVNGVNRKGESALHGAAYRGGNDIASVLVKHGASPYLRDSQGRTPYDITVGDGSRGLPGYESSAIYFSKLMASQFAQSGQTEIKQIKPNLYVIEASLSGADGPNLAFYATEEGVVLIDDRIDQNYQAIVARIQSVTNRPIRYIIKTHHHGEHTGAYKTLIPDAVTISHVNARKHMVEGKMAGASDIVFADETSLWLGGKEIRLIHPEPAHTDGDVVIYFPAERTVYVGDLMAATETVTNPTMDYAAGGSLEQWPATLDRVLDLEFDTVIPGTGYGVTGKAALKAHRDKVEKVRQRVRALIQARTSKDDLTKVLIDEFSFKPVNLRGVDGMFVEMSQ